MRLNVNRDRALILMGWTMLASFTLGYLVGVIKYEGFDPWLLVVMICLDYCAVCCFCLVYKMIPEDVDDEDLEGSDAECET